MGYKKIKVGILTFHMAHNYGAMLQAYALTTSVKNLGTDCEIIDYRFSYIDSWGRIDHFKDLIKKCGFLIGTLCYGKRLVTGYYRKNSMHNKFDYFERRIIPHSKKTYRKKSELDNMNYNIILFGSDQIWNSSLTGGIADEYVGNFKCIATTKKVAYAASCGTFDFQEESRAHYESLLDDFYAISVREEFFCKTLNERGYNVEWVLDPTLLLDADEWKKLINKNNIFSARKYILLYVFDEDERIYDLVRQYAKVRDLEIIAIAYKNKEIMYGMQVLTDCGPLEFLELFEAAEHVITTSFHGTAFSIIFHKDFHCIPHPKFHERTDSLLRLLGIGVLDMMKLECLSDVKIDWENVDRILEQNRNKSIDFLKSAIIE